MAIERLLRTIMRVLVALVGTLGAGCGPGIHFQSRPVQADTDTLSFDMNGDGRPDYWQGLDANGRKVELRFDNNGDGAADKSVRLDAPATPDVVHVVLVLDGVPFDVIDAMFRNGYFRLLPAPSRAISAFPVMTDVVLTKVFTDETALGYEAQYYDRSKGRPSNGNQVYLSGENAPWGAVMDYRCSLLLDAKSYLDPEGLWQHELAGIARTIRSRRAGTVRVYSVATAGLATRGGRPAIETYLRTVDALCEQLTYERQGQIRFTIFADHGHDLVPAKPVDLRPALERAGFQTASRLESHRDVYLPRYGLVSCAVLYTRDPEAVAAALADNLAIDLVMYPVPGEAAIAVCSSEGLARLYRPRPGRLRYQPVEGDPLRLLPILQRLESGGLLGSDGAVSSGEWLSKTATHVYPDAPWRIWHAFHGLVENPADVIVSLKPGYYCGSGFFGAMIDVSSTHGALTRRGSTAFAMSNRFELPDVLRVVDMSAYVRPDANKIGN